MIYGIPVAHNGKSHELAQGTGQFTGPKPAILLYIYLYISFYVFKKKKREKKRQNYHLMTEMRECGECPTTDSCFSPQSVGKIDLHARLLFSLNLCKGHFCYFV